jgi:hypothetical protein
MSAWENAELTDDAALTEYESSFPEAAAKIKGASGATAYDGKRAIAKGKIGRWLVKKGFALEGILDPSQFSAAATLLELSLIYRDMAKKRDSVHGGIADYYWEEYKEEIESLSFSYEAPATPPSGFVRSQTTIWRS